MKRIVAILLSISLVCLSPTITHAEEEQNNIELEVRTKNTDYSKGKRANDAEKTTYDSYTDFDTLMKEERGSKYKHSANENLKFMIAEDADEIRVSIKHNAEVDGETKLQLFNSDGNKVPFEYEYLPGEIVLYLRNVQSGGFYLKGDVSDGDVNRITTQSTWGFTASERIGSLPSYIQYPEEFDNFGLLSINDEIDRTLNKKDSVTVKELERLLQNYPLIPQGSLLKEEGVAEAFIKVQNEYNVSALGLLAIACLESAYGTSHIAVDKHNLFGWGAVDSNPYNGAWDWSDMPVGDAIYKAVSLIAKNYPRGKYDQSTYRKMRYNTDNVGNPIHQYCTSKTWIFSNAKIRAQLESYLGLR